MRFAYLSCDPGVPVFGTKGASIHVRQIRRALEQLGHEVAIFSPNADGDENERDPNVHHIPLAGFGAEAARLLRREDAGLPSHLAREFRRVLHSEQIQKTALPALKSFNPDVIYERYSLFGYAGVELAQTLGIPHLMEVNAPLSEEAAKHRELILKRTAEELESRILCSADALFVVSEPVAEFARGVGVAGDRISIVTTGVDPEQFRPDISGREVRARHGLDATFVIGFVGTLKPWHDLETLVSATKALAERGERVHLLIVGDGPQLEWLQALDADYITCTGAVPHDEVPQYMAAMDVVAVPYAPGGDQYFSPIKLFEAMASARPVVGANTGQVAKVIVAGENGLLYAPGDAQDLADKIRAVVQMPEQGKSLGLAARETVLKRYTWERNARTIVAVAQSLVEARA